jgi:hypothetical protein
MKNDLAGVISTLTKHSETLIKLDLDEVYVPLSFIAKFTNLQELLLAYDYADYGEPYKEFKELLHVSFPYL